MNNVNKRELNVMFTKAGSGSISCKLSIPKPWIKALGIDEEHRTVVATLEGDKIIISNPNK